MAAWSAEESHTLSLALMAIAGSLLVGNFAALSTFIALVSDRGEPRIIQALIVSSLLLVASIVAGGWRQHNLQAFLGALGVLITLVPPVLALTMRETVSDTALGRIEHLEAHAAALAQAGARLQALEASEAAMGATVDDLADRLSVLEAPAPDRENR